MRFTRDVNRYTVFACESQPVVVEGLRSALERLPDLELAGAAAPEVALPTLIALRPDVVLVSEQAGRDATLALLGAIREVAGDARIILWAREAGSPEDWGADAVAAKTLSMPALLDYLRAVVHGEPGPDGTGPERAPRPAAVRLTPRERDIVRLIGRGLKNREIAEALAIAPGTVKVHLMHVFEKTGARTRFEVAVGARRLLGETAGTAGGE